MESQDVILAKLVLGYLKSENCKAAYREFLRTSSCLQQLDISHNKYFATRFLGLTLEDILTEYSDLSQIIQGRLEATNYYNEDHPKESLVDQLLYLLNKVPASRPSTPGNSTPQGSYRDGGSPSHSDLDATRADTLPGNTHSKKSCSPRHRGFNRSAKKGPTTSSPIEKQNRSDLFNTEILAENLLVNREFHEKIAQTINKVVERQFDTTVQEVMQETEQDPIFDKILDEIIGSSNNMMELSKGSETNNTITSTTNISQENKQDRNDYVEHNLEKENNDSIKSNVDLHNASFKCPHQKSESNQQVTNLDSYLLTSQCSVATSSCIQNPVYINTVTGLLIPPMTTVVLNKSQPSPIATAILSEQDIMKMPIILKDDSKNTTNNKKKAGTKSTSVKTILPKPKIELAANAPKELKDYFKNYRPEEHIESPSTSKPIGLKHVIYPKTSKKSANPVKKSASNLDSNKSNKNNLPIISVDSIEDDDEEDEVIEILDSETKNKTPLPSDPSKKTTPKSGSHVRNLDFSTPLKLNVSKRKSDPTKNSKPPSEQKKAVKTLFKQSESKIWDSDLRILLNGEKASPKKPASSKKSKKKPKKTNHNTTEQEGLLLEAAIKTPVKNDTDQAAITSEQIEESEVIPDDTQSTQAKIISPFKLNAMKNNIETKSEEIVSKFITPDMAKETTALPIKANRNITPMLETPFKYQHLPKTPGIATPIGFNDDGTPFTKMMLDANLKDMDISSIETPSLLNTPGFPPNTPSMDLISPYANRPTDYSTGSSYYQPSDNEQNKILEAQVREVEKASASVNVASGVLKVADHVNIFNKNIIGKKNLSLIKKDFPDYEQSENSYSSEEEKDLSMEWCEKESNDTVIFKKKAETPKRTYSLRTRGKKKSPMKNTSNTKKVIKRPTKVAKKEIKKPESRGKKLPNLSPAEITGDIKSIITQTNEKSDVLSPKEPSMTTATPSEFSMLKDLERKRLRTIDSFKTTEPSAKPKKQVNGKFKIKPLPQVFTTKTGKKVESPRKRKRNKEMLRTVMNDLITSDDSEVHIESEDDDYDEEEKLKSNTKTDTVDKQSSDIEAQNLIEGLKERGIHLMQNKSPKKSFDNRDVINTSDLQLETLDRDIFDNKSSEGEYISIIYDENKKSTTLNRPQELETTEYIGKLYLESIDKEIDIHLKQTDFITLIDIKPVEKGPEDTKDHLNDTECKSEKRIKKISENNKVLNSKEQLIEKIEEISPKINTLEIKKSVSILSCHSSKEDEDLMNFAITGQEKMEENLSPKSSKKRRLSDDSESENSRTKMLKTLDVDSFLNKIHQKNFRPKK